MTKHRWSGFGGNWVLEEIGFCRIEGQRVWKQDSICHSLHFFLFYLLFFKIHGACLLKCLPSFFILLLLLLLFFSILRICIYIGFHVDIVLVHCSFLIPSLFFFVAVDIWVCSLSCVDVELNSWWRGFSITNLFDYIIISKRGIPSVGF